MMDSGHTCFECGKKIEGEDLKTSVLWANGFYHYPCYKIRTKPLQDEIDRLTILNQKKKKPVNKMENRESKI